MDTNPINLAFLEGLYEEYLIDPASVPGDWRKHFESLAPTEGGQPRFQTGTSLPTKRLFSPSSSGAGNGTTPISPRAAECISVHGEDLASLQHRVDLLIRNYRVRGHQIAHLDPLATSVPTIPELTPGFCGLTEQHMDIPFSTDYLAGGGQKTLREIIRSAQNTYCRQIGVQFMHIDDLEVRTWLFSRMESTENYLELSRENQLRTLTRLTDAVIFEEFIQKKFIGAKSFSLEGAETLIPLLDYAIETAGNQGVEEILIGMPHRGRLNVLANIMGKSPRQIFREFEDKDPELYLGRGDVKYHLGYHCDWYTAKNNKVHLSLAFNPSHLEFVNVVAQGRMRAKNDRDNDPRGDKGMTLLMHGDAAFAGEGIVQETLNLSDLEAFTTGGTLHVVVNNNIGFTTRPEQDRSTTYATDIARMLQVPIFHVNGEDPEAVAQVVNLALVFRHEFRKDVVIDMYCYRRLGHNEGDEPAFTQPVLYRTIRARKSVRDGYLENLLEMGGVTVEEADQIAHKRHLHLEEELSAARNGEEPDEREVPSGPDISKRPENILRDIWSRYKGGPEKDIPDVDTKLDREKLSALLESLATVPDNFHPHPKLVRLLKGRLEMAQGEKSLDWAAGEALAFASLADEGTRIRLTGQDSERGTFSHRHAVLHDFNSGEEYRPFQNIRERQGPVDIYNSALSEAGVLGFEYGYSGGFPDGLVIWEAQFGDFANVAQVIIDQFVATAEDKWRRPTGIVMLLPHGLEGTGPEHASARLERYLQMAAEDNMQIVNLTTPAQFFHGLRRQVLRPWRKPLIVMAPKSMLRNPQAVSALEDLSEGEFQRIIPDNDIPRKDNSRILLCTGKVYYDLVQERARQEINDIPIVRIEQLYPLDEALLEAALEGYAPGTPAYWVQEEPGNMGAWYFLHERLGDKLCGKFPFKGIHRKRSASPATGSGASHRLEQQRLIASALGIKAEHAGLF